MKVSTSLLLAQKDLIGAAWKVVNRSKPPELSEEDRKLIKELCELLRLQVDIAALDQEGSMTQEESEQAHKRCEERIAEVCRRSAELHPNG